MSAKPRYRCPQCGHVCTKDEMNADAWGLPSDEVWSNWICPNSGCHFWGIGDDGTPGLHSWIKVEEQKT